MARFRPILREVEQEAAAEAAAGGDVEATAHRAYRRHLADAQEAVESIGAVTHKTLRGFVIGAVVGFATVGIMGPLGVATSAAAGAVRGAVLDVRDVMRQRKTRGGYQFSSTSTDSASAIPRTPWPQSPIRRVRQWPAETRCRTGRAPRDPGGQAGTRVHVSTEAGSGQAGTPGK